jgi:DNA-binding CsgD family transcriptional regulator
MAASSLVERDRELSVLRDAIAAVGDGTGRVILIEGPPGIGKSSLLRVSVELAGTAGLGRLRARGEPLEQRFAYGLVRQLLEPALSTLAAKPVSGAEREAARILLGVSRSPREEEPGSGDVLHHGLYWIVAGLAERRPLLVAVDDAQWADGPSLRWLASLARRLDDLAVLLVVAARGDGSGADGDWQSLAASAAASLLTLEPLTPSAVGQMLETRLHAAIDPAVMRAAHDRTGGNPLLVGALLGALTGEATVERVAATMPPSIARIVSARLAALACGARELAQAVAVLGDGAALCEAAALAGIEPEAAAGLASELIGADVLCDGSSLTFRHAVVREAVLDGLTVPLRRAAHHRAAALLRESGAPLQRIAAQLLPGETRGEPWAVEVLRAAASEAVDRGAPDVAAELLARALQEPPAAGQRAAILAELGTAELHAGRPAGCERLREAIRLQPDARERARLALVLGLELAGMQREREAAATLEDGLASARAVDRELALRLEAHLAHAQRYDSSGEAPAVARLARIAAGVAGETPAERLVLAMDAALRPARDAAEATTFAARVQAGWHEGLVSLRAATGAVATYLYAGELDRARTFAEELLADARRRSLGFAHARASNMVAMVALAAGRVADAEAALVAAVDIETYGLPRPPVAVLIEVLIEMDRLEEAAAVLVGYRADGPLPSKMLLNPLLMARARLRAALHSPREALDDVLELGRRYAEWGLAGRPQPPWRGLAGTLLAARGEPERAGELVAEQLELARRWGSTHAVGVALRDLGTVRQDADALAESCRLLASTPFRLDHAYALVELGAVLRRDRRRAAAIEPLTAGMDLAHRCGSAALAARARTELLACGSRPRGFARSGRDALTASELRIARMAAKGMSNREIAQALFITIRTVTTHLGHAYGKLGITGREQLAEQLAERPPLTIPAN